MALGVGDFTARVADGGSMRLQDTQEGGSRVESFATNFKGKVAAFFRGLFKPGEVARENRDVMNAFVTSIRSDDRYGDNFADLAAGTLGRDIRAGKPLTARKVQQVMDQLQAAKRQNIGFTNFRAMIVSESDDLRPGTFGTMFADLAAERGMPVLIRDYDTTALSRSIKREVQQAGRDGLSIVPQERAEQIAKAKISSYLDRQLADKVSKGTDGPGTFGAMFAKIAGDKSMGTDPEEYSGINTLRNEIRNDVLALAGRGVGTVTAKMAQDIATARINVFLTNLPIAKTVSSDTSLAEGTFGSMFAKIAHDMGLPTLASAYDTKVLSVDIAKDIMALGSETMEPVELGEAQKIAREKITAFLTNVKENLGEVTKHMLATSLSEIKSNVGSVGSHMESGPEKTAMEFAVLTALGKVKPKAMNVAVQVQATATKLLTDMVDPKKSLDERLLSVKAFSEDVLKALGQHYDEVGSDDLNMVVKLALRYAGKMAGMETEDFERGFESCKGFKPTCEALGVPLTGQFVRTQEDMDDVRKAGNALTMLSRISEAFSEGAGLGTSIGTDILLDPTSVPGHPDQISEDGRHGMELLEVPIPEA